MTRTAMRTTIKAVALSVIAMIAGDARATHRTTPFLMEIPFQTSSTDPSVPPQALGIQEFRPFSQGESARWISFDSTSDLMGNGSTGSEIFIFDNELPRSLTQVTQCPVGENTNPANTANGKTVVFESTGNISAPVSTRCTQLLPAHRIMRAQFNNGVWGYDELTGGLAPADCTEPTITAEGFRVAFQCAGDLRRTGSPGTNIYLWRNDLVCDFQSQPPCSKVQQITPPGNWVSGNAEFDLVGTKLVFNSNAPIGGPSNGSQQIYLYQIVTNSPFPDPIRLTNGVGDSTNPSLDVDGRLVVFQSTADLLGTGSTGSELFLLDRDTGILRQITDGDGDSTQPSMGGGGRYIIFLSTGAFAGGGLGAPQVMLYDLIDEALYQVTNSGSAGNPIATADTIFFFDSDGDPLGLGLTGRHVYALNVFRQLPPRALGAAKFQLLPGKQVAPGSGRMSGSSVRIINASTFNADPATTHMEFPIGNQSLGAGELNLAILGRNPDKEGKVAATKVIIPPIPVPSFGAICLQQTGRGEGEIDCDGDALDTEPFLEAQGDALDYRTLQDHVTNLSSPGHPAEDPFCQIGCKEGSECPGPLQAPPGVQCYRCKSEPGVCAEGPRVGQECEFDTQCPGRPPVLDPLTGAVLISGACDLTRPQTDPFNVAHLGTCLSGTRDNLWCDTDGECPADCLTQQTCVGGPNDGQTCDSDRDCDTLEQCDAGTIDICQGPPVLTRSGSFDAGDMALTVPMVAKFATNPGLDGNYCTADDTYALAGSGLEAVLRLTTGTAKATIADVDYHQGQTIGASEEGSPFSCQLWEDTRGRIIGDRPRLVGALTFLNVPNIPFQHDTIVTFRFENDPGPECIGDACAHPCTDDLQCRDSDPCNGEEFCHLGSCHTGVPVSCGDGNEFMDTEE